MSVTPDCSQHPKDLFGKTDMKEVAEAIGNLSYPQLADMFLHLRIKIAYDSIKDKIGGRKKLAMALHMASEHIDQAAIFFREAEKISKPFMK